MDEQKITEDTTARGIYKKRGRPKGFKRTPESIAKQKESRKKNKLALEVESEGI